MFLACYVRLDYTRSAPAGERLRLVTAGDGASPVHLCGPTVESLADAEELARATVRSHGDTVRGQILPRVFRYQPGDSLLDVGDRAEQWFLDKLAEMNEADLASG
jgi:hypothetical protein